MDDYILNEGMMVYLSIFWYEMSNLFIASNLFNGLDIPRNEFRSGSLTRSSFFGPEERNQMSSLYLVKHEGCTCMNKKKKKEIEKRKKRSTCVACACDYSSSSQGKAPKGLLLAKKQLY
jgi:hypothetical protein